MRNLLLLIITCFFTFAIQAQKYGNEWINFSQQYYKIPIAKEGLYRIDSTRLAAYYNLNTTNPDNFQLFIKGKEQFIHVQGGGDGKINTGDFIEFYANNFMGDVDSLLYTNIKYMPNPYLPIYNDTLYGFLTLNNSASNKRYVIETDTNSAAYTTADRFYTEKIFTQFSITQSSYYNAVEEYDQGSSDPHLTQAEGKGTPVSKGASYTPFVSGLNTYTNTSLPFYVTINYSGESIESSYSPDHQVQLFYSDQNNNPVLFSDTTFYGYVPVRKKITLNSQNTNNSTAITLSSVAAPSFNNDNQTMLHCIHYFYPHTTDLNIQTFFKMVIDNSSSSPKNFFNFSNFNTFNSASVILLDIANGKRINTTINGTYVRAIIPNGLVKPICAMIAEKDTQVVKKLIPVNQNGNFINYKNISASNPYVIIYHKSLSPSAQSYRQYRQSGSGGGFNVIDADIETLYEQFSYGIRKHPLSIRNFIKYLKDSLQNPPNYVLLIGKGLDYSHAIYPPFQAQNLIPTIGIPSSDNMLTASLSSTNTNGFYPEIPIGRLAVLSNSEVTNYLEKVQTHESPSLAVDWKKKVLHFVGGDTEALSDEINNYMSVYEQIIKDTLFGANVGTFKKNTTAPIQTNISDSLRNVINMGAALINFFGHGSPSGFDQAVDDPDVYSNKDKYPFIIANSCLSGDIHLGDVRSVSERFVIANQKGSIGFLATTSYGFPHNLDNFTNGFYKSLSQTDYNKGIGDIIKKTIFQNSTGELLTQLTGLDMTLCGDPAIKISNGLLPDYQIFNADVNFDLKKYTDSVGVKIHYKNLGMAPRDTIAIRIERYLANNDSITVIKKVRAAMYADSLIYYFPLDFNNGIGLNNFNIKIDAFQQVTEVSESNNNVGPLELFIPGGDLLPVYPYKYAIVPKTQTITLKASTTNPFAPSTSYRFQLDTCDKFINPISTTLITSSGGVLEWKVNLPYKDSTVYFWRVSRDSISAQKTFAWRESSFQTIGDKRGWGQAHFNQFKNDKYQFVNYNKALRKFIFLNDKHSIKARTGIHPFPDISQMSYYFDSEIKEGWPSGFNGWNIAVFDSISAQPQVTKSNNYPGNGLGIYNNYVETGIRYIYTFGAISGNCPVQANWKVDMENFLNSIAPNQYVLAYSLGYQAPAYSDVESYSSSLYAAFESIGAKNIQTVKDSVGYILFGRKGMSAGQAHVVIGANKKTIITLEDSIQTRWRNGYVASEIIGPSYKWNSLHWRVKSTDNGLGDTTVLKLVGITAKGQIDTLTAFNQDSSDVLSLSSYVNAQTYPYLQLVAFMRDNVHRTSPQLQRWQVLYDEAPECAINPLKGFASINDTLLEGDQVTFRFPIENIGVKDFTDSLVITYWIENKDLVKIPLPQRLKRRPFVAGQVLVDTVTVDTYQFKGNNALWIYVNPVSNSKYQYEQSQFNNIGRFPFKVNSDVTNPLLDVTFDGVRILNGDIVSAKPNVLITLKDENKFLALNDTSAFSIFLVNPDQKQQRIYFGNQLQFTPANLPKNSCSINYSPVFAVDGKYALVVQATDRSKNLSAAREYRVQFEIYNKPSVTQVLNYPNPFSTSTRFVFTLTGSDIPEVFTIQIMTITGKIVREITRHELGNLHIGRNITDYAWDGRDNYGDRLANGVYLYRVQTKLNGENMDKNASGADKYFVKDFGKMVLMR